MARVEQYAASNPSPMEQDDGGIKEAAVHGLGWVIGNPVSKAVLKPLTVLDYPRAGVTGLIRQGLETGAMEDLNRALAKLPGIDYTPIARPEGNEAGFQWGEVWRDLKKHEGFGTSIIEPQFGGKGYEGAEPWNINVRRALGFLGDIGSDPLMALGGGTKAASGAEARFSYVNKLLDAQKVAGREAAAANEAADVAAQWARLGGTGAEEAQAATRAAAERANQELEALTKIGNKDAIDVINRRGVNAAKPEQLAAMGVPSHAIRLHGVPIQDVVYGPLSRLSPELAERAAGRVEALTEPISRNVSRALAPGKELWTRTAGAGLRKIKTPTGAIGQNLGPATERLLTGAGGMSREVALRTHAVNETMRLAKGEFRSQGLSYLDQLAEDLKGFTKEERAQLVQVAEETGVENAATKMGPQMIEVMKSLGLDPPELKPWKLPNGEMSRYTVPHVLSRDAFRFFNRLRKGQNPLLDFIRRDLGVTDRDLLEEGGFLQRRLFRPNADGSPKVFKIGEDEITITTGSLAELEDKLGGLLRKHGFEGNLYETDPVEAWRRYIKSTEKDVARDVGFEHAAGYGLEGLERKRPLPKSWDPFGRDIQMQPREGTTEPRYVRGPTTEQRPASTNQYEWVEDPEATKARNKIITEGGSVPAGVSDTGEKIPRVPPTHEQVLSEFQEIAGPQRENIAQAIEATRQQTEAAFEKARALGAKNVARTQKVLTAAREKVDKLEAEFLELLKESSANEQIMRAQESTIHGIRSQTPKNIARAQQERLAEIAAELEHQRGHWERLQAGLEKALQADSQAQVDEALEAFATKHENLAKAEREMAEMREKATRAVKRRIERESQGRDHLIGPVESRQAREVVGNAEASTRAQELLARRERLTTGRAEAEAEAQRLQTEADRVAKRLETFGDRPGRTEAQQARIEASRAEMEAQVRQFRREANQARSRANGYGMSLRDAERRIADDPWLKAQDVVKQYDTQQARIEDYAATHGIDMKAAQTRLNKAQTELQRYELEQRPPRPTRDAAAHAVEQMNRPDLTEYLDKTKRLDELNQELQQLGSLPDLAGEKPPTKLTWAQPREGGRFVEGEYQASTQPEQWGRTFHVRDPETGEIIWTGDYDPRGREQAIRAGEGKPRPIVGYTRNNPPYTGFRVNKTEEGWRLTLPGESEPIDRVFRTQYLAREAAEARWPSLRREMIRTGEGEEARRAYIEELRQEQQELSRYAKENTNKGDEIDRLTRPEAQTREGMIEQARTTLDSPEAQGYISDERVQRDLQRRINEIENPAEAPRQPADWQEVGRQGPAAEPRPLREWRKRNGQRRRLLGEMERVRQETYLTKPPTEEPFKLIKMPKREPRKYIGKPVWWKDEYGPARASAARSKRSATMRLKKLQVELDKVESWLAEHPQPPRPAFTENARKFRATINGKRVVLERVRGIGANAPAEWRITSRGAEESFRGTLAEAFERAENFGVTRAEADPEALAALRERLAAVEERLGDQADAAKTVTDARRSLQQNRAPSAGEPRFGETEYPPIPEPTREELVRQRFEPNIAKAERRIQEFGGRGTPAELEGIRTEMQGVAQERIGGLQAEHASTQFQQERIHSMITDLYQNRMPDPVRDWQQALNNADQARAVHDQISEAIKEWATKQRALDIVEKQRRAGAPTLKDLEAVAKRQMRPEDAQGLMAAVDDIDRWISNAGDVLPANTRKRIEAALMSHEQALASLTRGTDLPARAINDMVRDAHNGKLPAVLKAQIREAYREVGQDGGILIHKDLERAMFGVDQVLDSKLFGRLFTTWTNFFKTYATLTPGFHVRNALSAIFMNATEGVGVREQLRALRLWKQYRAAENPVEFLRGLPEAQRNAFRATFASGAGGQFVEGGVGEARAGVGRAVERVFSNPATRLSKRAGSWVEGPQRLALGLHTTEAGGSVTEALHRITRIHFDYGQVSKFDEQMKRIIPFWTFMSRNIPLQFTQMWMKPKMYLAYQSAARNLALGTEDQPVIPSYIQQAGGIYFGAKTPKWASKIPIVGPPAGMPIVAQPDLPQFRYMDDLQRIQNALSGQGLGQMATNLNPMITVPAEFTSRTDFFTGQQFQPNDTVQVGGVAIPYAIAMSMFGQARRGADGKWYVDAAAMNAARGLDPNLDKVLRLLPQVAGGEGGDRQAESWGRWAGLPVRTISEAQQRSELRSRARQRYEEAQRVAATGG
jgi:hypothetical protein